MTEGYVGRFAPSPTGPLHAGSIVAALASWLDARAHAGRWLLRIEDIDGPRNVPGAVQRIRAQLDFLGLVPDAPVVVQSTRDAAYQTALDRLRDAGRLYGCACTRREIEQAVAETRPDSLARHRESIYPGTCRHGLQPGQRARAWRFRVSDDEITFDDRWLGLQCQHPAEDTGDFVVRRADGLWAYQLAVVVDDAAAGVTDVVRGQDLLSSTGRQIQLQRALGTPTPRYLHLPLVQGADGQKLSKQNGATAVPDPARDDPCAVLATALRTLGIEPPSTRDPTRWHSEATDRWRERLLIRSAS